MPLQKFIIIVAVLILLYFSFRGIVAEGQGVRTLYQHVKHVVHRKARKFKGNQYKKEDINRKRFSEDSKTRGYLFYTLSIQVCTVVQ